MEHTPERWRPVKGFEDSYEVSSHGMIRSLPRVVARSNGKPLRVKGQLLKTNPNSRGYPRVSLCAGPTRATWAAVHRLVAAAFLGQCADGMTVNHIDGDKTNNRVDNLEYVTAQDNIRHARDTGLLDVRGVNNPRTKLTEDEVKEIRRMYSAGARQVDLAEQFNIHQTNVSRIVLRKSFPLVT